MEDGEALSQVLVEKAVEGRIAGFRGRAAEVTFVCVGIDGQSEGGMSVESVEALFRGFCASGIRVTRKFTLRLLNKLDHGLKKHSMLAEGRIIGFVLENWHSETRWLYQ